MKQYRVSVVIPNYNGAELLPKVIPSVRSALAIAEVAAYEIIIPDDCSTDSSVAYLQTAEPDVIILENEKNQGFAANINRGIFRAKYELVLILNSDMILDKDYFKYQFSYFDNPNTFGVMGRVNNATQKVYQLGWNGLYPLYKTQIIPADAVGCPLLLMSGGNSLLDRDKLIKLGGFEDLFSPFYGEDDELGIRANRYGWDYYYEGRSKCDHAASTTIKTHFQKKFIKKITMRNKLYLQTLHLSIFELTIFYFIHLLKIFTFWILLKFNYYQALFMYLQNIHLIFRKRKKINKSAIYSFRDLTNKMIEKQKRFLRKI